MTPAESALETARKELSEHWGDPACWGEADKDIARALIRTRIEAMQDCARERCVRCFSAEKYSDQPFFEGEYVHSFPYHKCTAQYEQSEIARLTAELEKLK